MKIALLSFHNAANYGAALQAYALQRFLQDKGIDCEYINYVNDTRKHMYDMFYLTFNNLFKGHIKSAFAYTLGSPFLNLRKYRFHRFYKKYLKVTTNIYRTSEEAKMLNDQYDYFIVGSDQVWAPENNGEDTAFLLDFVTDNRKKISYSSSFGTAQIAENLKKQYAQCLSSFYALSVRETIGQKLIKNLIGRNAELVVDPVFLLTIDHWKEIMKSKIPNRKYIFSYTNTDKQIYDFLQTGYNTRGKLHYILSRYTRPSDFLNKSVRVKYCMAPEEFLNVIYYADMIVTASFHCMALAILMNKQFVVMLTGNNGKDERLINLLHYLNLDDRIWNSQMTISDIEKSIDYEHVNNKINELKNTSINYLMTALS